MFGLDLLLNFLILADFELAKSAVQFKANKLTLNVKKTKFIVFAETNSHIGNYSLKLGDTTIEQIEQIDTNCKQNCFRFLDVHYYSIYML